MVYHNDICSRFLYDVKGQLLRSSLRYEFDVDNCPRGTVQRKMFIFVVMSGVKLSVIVEILRHSPEWLDAAIPFGV